MLVSRAGKSTQFMYLSKSTSNLEKSYSSRSKSTKQIFVLEVQVKSKQFNLKYTQKYFYRPKNIILARLEYVTISQAFLLVKVSPITRCDLDNKLFFIVNGQMAIARLARMR